jgi:hypothetical protein
MSNSATLSLLSTLCSLLLLNIPLAEGMLGFTMTLKVR